MLVIILGIVGASAGQILQATAKSIPQADTQLQIETGLVSTMESLRGKTFDQLLVGSPSSTVVSAVTINGVSVAPTVNVTLADANGDGAADATFKQITVQIQGQSLSTLVNKP